MRTVHVFIVILFLFCSSSYAQIEGIPQDSIAVYLSKNWKEKARFLNAQQVAIFGEPMMYEFKKDSTFVKIYDKKFETGTWSYDTSKKVVQVNLGNKRDWFVVMLTRKEMLFAAEVLEGDKKGLGILVLLHPVE